MEMRNIMSETWSHALNYTYVQAVCTRPLFRPGCKASDIIVYANTALTTTNPFSPDSSFEGGTVALSLPGNRDPQAMFH